MITPEDEYPRWSGAGGPVTVAPLFLLYDYTFRLPGQADADEALEAAYGAGVVATDEYLLHPDPYPDRVAWCHAAGEDDRGPARRAAGRHQDRAGQPLAADPAADPDAAAPASSRSGAAPS